MLIRVPSLFLAVVLALVLLEKRFGLVKSYFQYEAPRWQLMALEIATIISWFLFLPYGALWLNAQMPPELQQGYFGWGSIYRFIPFNTLTLTVGLSVLSVGAAF